MNFSGFSSSNDPIWEGQLAARTFSDSVGQAYFWLDKWQSGERAADHDLARGEYEDFDSADDAVSWLFGDDC